MMGRVSLVAHRGQPLIFPENSLPGYVHALQAGARYVETDIQICADGVPVLCHDANLLEVSGKQIIVADHEYAVISQVPVGFAERFGDRFQDYRIATLQQFVDLMTSWPDVTCFIELKEACLQNFGMKSVDLVLEQIQPIRDQAVLISYSDDALAYAREHQTELPIGWVLPAWNGETHNHAVQLQPEFLFVDTEICPQDKAEIWAGDWQWVAFTINDREGVEHFAGLAIEIIETDRYSDLVSESDIIEVSNDI